jgi:glycosyltransferase involved in cell wall biosynthesis
LIHFLISYAKPGARTPFTEEIEKLGIPHRIISHAVDMSYRRRWQLFFKCLPSLAKFGIISAWKSLRSHPAPDAVVLNSDIEVLAFALARILLRRFHVKFVLSGFIYTHRQSLLLSRLRRFYFTLVLNQVSYVICHSTLEVSRNREIFPSVPARFVLVPWGGHLNERATLLEESSEVDANPQTGKAYALTAGRSGRDYHTLFRAWRGVDLDLHAICDFIPALPKESPERVKVVSGCYGGAYLREMARSLFVVIPLAPSDISVGQMVLVQAMALGKACIITRTPTTVDYVRHEQNGLFVEPGDAAQLRCAILRLIADQPLRDRLARAALKSFEQRHAFPVYVGAIVRIAQEAANEGLAAA